MTEADDPKPYDQIARARAELLDGTFVQNARQRAARRKSPWNLLLPAILLPLWFALGFTGFEAAWRLHLAWHPQDIGHMLEYWRHGMDAPRFMMLIPPMVGALPLAMILTNFLVSLIPAARRAMDSEDRGVQGVDYASSQRALIRFAAVVSGVSACAAILGAWMP